MLEEFLSLALALNLTTLPCSGRCGHQGAMLFSAVVMRDPSPTACCSAVAVDVSAFTLHLTTLYVFCFFPLICGFTLEVLDHVVSVQHTRGDHWCLLSLILKGEGGGACLSPSPLLQISLKGNKNKGKIIIFSSPFSFTQINWQERAG